LTHAGVIRGAPYHHRFPDEKCLFLAVFHDVEASLTPHQIKRAPALLV
jgi:hypothetical protein